MGLSGRSHGEETIHALEWNALSFGNEEEDEEDGQNHHSCEEEIYAAA